MPFMLKGSCDELNWLTYHTRKYSNIIHLFGARVILSFKYHLSWESERFYCSLIVPTIYCGLPHPTTQLCLLIRTTVSPTPRQTAAKVQQMGLERWLQRSRYVPQILNISTVSPFDYQLFKDSVCLWKTSALVMTAFLKHKLLSLLFLFFNRDHSMILLP